MIFTKQVTASVNFTDSEGMKKEQVPITLSVYAESEDEANVKFYEIEKKSYLAWRD